ncbi:DEAD/DEAH box helicase [bacterium]|nr:DEAD/DEAH box helicase [bacterium]MBU4024159.1 DEAD/DEAH box helicase [bacterium]MBU4110274.1 DEAD/DEAH box helicase [bacterium]
MSEEAQKTSPKKYYDNVNIGKRTKQIVYLAEEEDKAPMLAFYLANSDKTQTVVVTKSKRRADELSAFLKTQEITATPIHGNHRALQIEEATNAFNNGELKILITTDMILQSLELSAIVRIVNYDLPSNHEDYFSRLVLVDEVGESILFVAPEEKGFLNIIEIKLKNEIPVEELESFVLENENLYIHASKENTKKKPRHLKKKTKTVVKNTAKKERF